MISLPVFADPAYFADPAKPTPDNWSTASGFVYGTVLDPPPVSIVVGGHAVAITGFMPDREEHKGGYFIVRNSWGVEWGANAPARGLPEPGYGRVSATYVDNFLWEMCAFARLS